MISESKFDAVVVGAGPAGSTAAYELAKLGVNVALLEKDKLPRNKLCGGGVTLKTKNLLPFAIDPVVHQTINKIILLHNGHERLQISDGRPLLVTTMRSEFDFYLTQKAEEAGAKLFPQQPLLNMQQGDGAYELSTTGKVFSTKVVVGADGANSRVARLQKLREDPFIVLGIESEAPIGETFGQNDWTKGAIVVEVGRIRHGYAWLFPKRETLTIGVGGPAVLSGEIISYYDRFLDREVGRGVEKKFKGHHLPIRKPDMPIQREGVLLVGDAAGLVEPFTGEGIYYAVRSGQIAARETERLLSGEISDFSDYQKKIDEEIMPDIETGQLLSSLVSRFPRLAIFLLTVSRERQRFLCQVVRGEKKMAESAKLAGVLEPLFGPARRMAMRDDRWNFMMAIDPMKASRRSYSK